MPELAWLCAVCSSIIALCLKVCQAHADVLVSVQIDLIVFCCFLDRDIDAYGELLPVYFPIPLDASAEPCAEAKPVEAGGDVFVPGSIMRAASELPVPTASLAPPSQVAALFAAGGADSDEDRSEAGSLNHLGRASTL